MGEGWWCIYRNSMCWVVYIRSIERAGEKEIVYCMNKGGQKQIQVHTEKRLRGKLFLIFFPHSWDSSSLLIFCYLSLTLAFLFPQRGGYITYFQPPKRTYTHTHSSYTSSVPVPHPHPHLFSHTHLSAVKYFCPRSPPLNIEQTLEYVGNLLMPWFFSSFKISHSHHSPSPLPYPLFSPFISQTNTLLH